jgi:hypothetical protein
LTGCSTAPRPTPPSSMTMLLNDWRLVWLGKNLDDPAAGYLHGWLSESLIPYVVELENR